MKTNQLPLKCSQTHFRELLSPFKRRQNWSAQILSNTLTSCVLPREDQSPLLKLTSVFPTLCILLSAGLGNVEQHFLTCDFALYFLFSFFFPFFTTIIIYLKCLFLITVNIFPFLYRWEMHWNRTGWFKFIICSSLDRDQYRLEVSLFIRIHFRKPKWYATDL